MERFFSVVTGVYKSTQSAALADATRTSCGGAYDAGFKVRPWPKQISLKVLATNSDGSQSGTAASAGGDHFVSDAVVEEGELPVDELSPDGTDFEIVDDSEDEEEAFVTALEDIAAAERDDLNE